MSSSGCYDGGKFDDLQQEGLISLWRRRDGGIYVKLPTRPFTVNGEKREYRLLRARRDKQSVAAFCDWLRAEYEKFAATASTAA